MSDFPMISYREFDRLMESGRIEILIDLREPGAFSLSRILGAKNLPYSRREEWFERLPKERRYVFYCDRGAKSMVICRDLWRKGIFAADLAGGILNYRGKYIDRRPSGALE